MLNFKKEEIIKLAGKTAEYALYIMIFTLPFSRSMIEICFVTALVSWAVKRIMQGTPNQSLITVFKPLKTGLNLPIYVFVALGAVSTITSVSLSLSLEGLFFKIFEWVMFYFITVEVINDKSKVGNVLFIMLLSVFIVAGDTIFQFITGRDLIRNFALYGEYVVRGPFVTQNSFAAWLLTIIPLVLIIAYLKIDIPFIFPQKYTQLKKFMQHNIWVLLLIMVSCLLLTYSRGAWMAAVLALIFLGCLTDKRLFVIISIIILILPFAVPDSMRSRVAALTQIDKIDRFFLWTEAINITKDFPLLGCGPNTYAAIAPYYKVFEEGGVYPHNSYLQMAAESGMLGLGAFLWILAALFKMSLRSVKKINDKFYGAILASLLAGLFGLLAHSFVDTDIYSLQLGNLIWFLMGLIIAVQKVALQESNPPKS